MTSCVRTGVDLVEIESFERSMRRGGEPFRRRLFHPTESAGASLQRLAGIFAAKEAAFKALELPAGNWHVVQIAHRPDGRPFLCFAPEYDASRIASLDLSITHCGEYAFASVVALIRDDA
jgi:phosphopantetheine--protein transferase-like protein